MRCLTLTRPVTEHVWAAAENLFFRPRGAIVANLRRSDLPRVELESSQVGCTLSLYVRLSVYGVARRQCVSQSLFCGLVTSCVLPVEHISPAVRRLVSRELSQERVEPVTF